MLLGHQRLLHLPPGCAVSAVAHAKDFVLVATSP